MFILQHSKLILAILLFVVVSVPAYQIKTAFSCTDGQAIVWESATGAFKCSSGGGSDPWTYISLSSQFATTSGSAVDVTGLEVTPTANNKYIVEGQFLLRTSSATVIPKIGVGWPTISDGVGWVTITATATTRLTSLGNPNASLLTVAGSLPNATQSWPSHCNITLVSGATPSGTLRIQLASETAGTSVSMETGSWIRYRTY